MLKIRKSPIIAGAATAVLLAMPLVAPAGAWAPAAKPTPLHGTLVTIDPGHNGGNASHPSEINRQVPIGQGQTKECDTTGTETNSGYAEYAYTMSVARKLKGMLRRAGAKVVLTRRNSKGVGPCINRRAKIGNRADSDAAVSIHADGGPASGRGFHLIYPTKIHGLTNDIYRPSRRLAKRMRSSYEAATQLPRANYIGHNGLDARGDLGGLRLSNVPKVFIETANMRNAADAHKIKRPRFRKRVARGIFGGLKRFMTR